MPEASQRLSTLHAFTQNRYLGLDFGKGQLHSAGAGLGLAGAHEAGIPAELGKSGAVQAPALVADLPQTRLLLGRHRARAAKGAELLVHLAQLRPERGARAAGGGHLRASGEGGFLRSACAAAKGAVRAEGPCL